MRLQISTQAHTGLLDAALLGARNIRRLI